MRPPLKYLSYPEGGFHPSLISRFQMQGFFLFFIPASEPTYLLEVDFHLYLVLYIIEPEWPVKIILINESRPQSVQ